VGFHAGHLSFKKCGVEKGMIHKMSKVIDALRIKLPCKTHDAMEKKTYSKTHASSDRGGDRKCFCAQARQ